ncbi:type ISP restriction/modification enzyme, partial [Roseofilum capinflatum]
MSKLLISEYQREVEEIIRYGGSRNESSIRGAFQKLLGDYCKTKDFRLIPELEYATKNGKLLYPDGTVKDALRLDWGYWESKDEYDNLDEEIEKKFTKGYPRDNIIFEDSQTAVLIQGDSEQLRVSMQDVEALDQLLQRFIDYERPEVKGFREALEQFKQDVPAILVQLRENISQASQNNKNFQEKRDKFLQICRNSINPEISLEDVREMIIQHILTEDIFTNIFNESQFHRENNIARTLSEVVQTFFTGAVRRNTLGSIEHYYAVIRRSAANIANHHEKQKFLKVVYENFYKAYNPKAADRLGIVYTPNEIVRFMIESTDYLLHQHFGKVLGDEGVEILDPATGTGTFITELIEYLPAHQLRYKYLNEIHCNEVAILPYYIANLNIEYTYQQKMGEYLEFENICFVDTLDHTAYDYKQMDLFAMTLENTERIQRQNDREISVIIGNPPYNAWQESFNDNNANRVYRAIDQRIRETYVKQGTAQNQNALYDMYVRFYRWATDRISKNGIITFVTNSSFINALTFDGFRKVVQREFRDIYLIDLGGNIRAGDKTGNVFGIKVGVALGFLVKRESSDAHPCSIHYWSASELQTVEEKLAVLASRKFEQFEFKHIQPDKKQNWIKLTDNDFDQLLPLVDKEVKAGRSQEAVFQLFSRGIATQRDEWVYDFSDKTLSEKMQFFVDTYQRTLADPDHPERNQIKWDRELTKYLQRRIVKQFDQGCIVRSLYRPYTKQYLYFDRHFNGMTYQWFSIYPDSQSENISIWMKMGSEIPFFHLATQYISDLLPQGGSQCLPLYRYDENGNRQENITDWALEQFQSHYGHQGVPSSPSPFSHGRRGAEVSLPGERDLERGHNPGQHEGVPSSPNPFSHGRRGA